MRLKELKLGKSIELYVTRDKYKLRLVSKIEDVASDHIAITAIRGHGRIFQFVETDQIEFIYKDEQRLWRFVKLKAVPEQLDGEIVHCLYGNSEGESFNRRNAYRVYLGEEIRFDYVKAGHEAVLYDKEEFEEEKHPYLFRRNDGIVKDLSETGAGIYSNEILEKHDVLSFSLLTNLGRIDCKGEVVRTCKESHGMYRNYYGVSFTQVSNSIAKYIFVLQRQQLQKARK